MLRSSSLPLSLLLMLAACGSLSPADRARVLSEGHARETSLGELFTFDAPPNTTNFAVEAVLGKKAVFVAESSDEATCGNRLRRVRPSVEGDLLVSDPPWNCLEEGTQFALPLSSSGGFLVAGVETFRRKPSGLNRSPELPTADSTPGDGFASVSAAMDIGAAAVSAPDHGQSGAVYLFETEEQYFDSSLKLSQPELPADAGFGTTLFASQFLLVVGDRIGNQFGYAKSLAGDWSEIELPGEVLALHRNTLLVRPFSGGTDLHFYDRAGDTWDPRETLVDADVGFTTWHFDEIAAFGSIPTDGQNPGRVQRYARLDGQLDGTLEFPSDHADLLVDLYEEFLLVAEAPERDVGENGRVNWLDWTADRDRMIAELTCPPPHPDSPTGSLDPVTDPPELPVTRQSIGADEFQDYRGGLLMPGEGVYGWLSHSTFANMQLYLVEADGTRLHFSTWKSPDESLLFVNESTEPVEVFWRVLMDADLDPPCGSYLLRTEPYVPESQCVDDQLEPNNNADAGWDLTPSLYNPDAEQHELVAYDNDWFDVTMRPGQHIDVALNSVGDLDLHLYDDDTLLLDVSDNGANEEAVSAGHLGSQPTTWTFSVTTSETQCLPYELALTHSCTEDGLGDIHAPEDAMPLSNGSISGLAAGEEADWFSVEMTEGDTLSLELFFVHLYGDLDLEIRDSADEVVAEGQSLDDNESLTWTSPITQTVWVKIYDYNETDCNPYTLNANLESL